MTQFAPVADKLTVKIIDQTPAAAVIHKRELIGADLRDAPGGKGFPRRLGPRELDNFFHQIKLLRELETFFPNIGKIENHQHHDDENEKFPKVTTLGGRLVIGWRRRNFQ